MDRIDPQHGLRLFDRLDVEINGDRFAVAAHQHAFQGLVAAGVDLLMRHIRLTDTPENRNRNLRTDGQPFIPPAGQSALPVAPVETPEAGETR